MDPTAAYQDCYEAMRARDFETARQRAVDLRQWLGKGGFYPPKYSKVEVDSYVASVLRRTAYLDRPSRS